MENFYKFIDDIRKEIKCLDVSFVYGDTTMILTVPPSQKKYVVDPLNIGKIEYDTPEYRELLEMTVELLQGFNQKEA